MGKRIINLTMNVLATFISSFLLGRKREKTLILDKAYFPSLELNFYSISLPENYYLIVLYIMWSSKK